MWLCWCCSDIIICCKNVIVGLGTWIAHVIAVCLICWYGYVSMFMLVAWLIFYVCVCVRVMFTYDPFLVYPLGRVYCQEVWVGYADEELSYWSAIYKTMYHQNYLMRHLISMICCCCLYWQHGCWILRHTYPLLKMSLKTISVNTTVCDVFKYRI